jgi:hypothetical protein
MFDPHLIVQELALMRLFPEYTKKKLEFDPEFKKSPHRADILNYLIQRVQDRPKEELSTSIYKRGWYIDPTQNYECSEKTTDSCAWVYSYHNALLLPKKFTGAMAGWYADQYHQTSWYSGKFNLKENQTFSVDGPEKYPCNDESVWNFIVHGLWAQPNPKIWQTTLQNYDDDKDLKTHKWEKNFAVGTSYNASTKNFDVNFMTYDSISQKNCPNYAHQKSNYYNF